METTFILLNEPHMNTAWAVSTVEQICFEGDIYSVFPYLGQRKINSRRVRDISLPIHRRLSMKTYLSKFLQIARLKNSAIKAGESVWQFGDLSYIQTRISKIAQESDHIRIVSDYSLDHPKSQIINEFLNLLDYFCQHKKIIPVTIYCKKDWYSESEDYEKFWIENRSVVGQRKTILVTRPNWINCGTDTHTRNLLQQFSNHEMAYVQLLISPSTSSHQHISPYKRTENFAKLNDFVHVLTRIQLIKIAFTLFFNSKVEKSVVLTHELIYSMSTPKYRIRKLLKQFRPDFFFVTHYFNIKRVLKMRNRFGHNTVMICDTHDIQSINYEQQGYRQYLRRRIANLKSEINIECKILDQCDHLIFLSESEKAFYDEHTDKHVPSTLFTPPVEVIKIPARGAKKSKTSSPSKSVLLVMSNNLGNQLGLDWFIKEIVPLIPLLKIRVVGGIQTYAKKKPAWMNNDQLDFAGVVEDLRQEYIDADVVAVPVVRGAGVAIKTLEALAYGKPIVASPLGLRGIKSNLSKYFIAQTPTDFASMLIQICKSPAKARLQEGYSKRLQKEISPRMQFQKVLNLFENSDAN